MLQLFLTSLLIFIPSAAILQVGMVAASLYVLALLLVEPYIRSTDQRMHVFTQVP